MSICDGASVPGTCARTGTNAAHRPTGNRGFSPASLLHRRPDMDETQETRQAVRFYRCDGTEAAWAYGYGDTRAERYTSARTVIEATAHVHKWGLR